MLKRALNHMAAPQLNWQDFIELASAVDCMGVEFRNDLGQDLFDGAPPEDVGAACAARKLQILALAEIKAFDDWSADKLVEARDLVAIARACGARRVSLIARNDGVNTGQKARLAALDHALDELAPLLADNRLIGLIEPLGFTSCALRYKSEVAEAIDRLGTGAPFEIVHDTFHHALAGAEEVFPQHTGIVHVSGITRPDVTVDEMTDPDRGLVSAGDRLGNVAQLAALKRGGYDGAVSFEPFAPEIRMLDDPALAYRRSFAHIETELG